MTSKLFEIEGTISHGERAVEDHGYSKENSSSHIYKKCLIYICMVQHLFEKCLHLFDMDLSNERDHIVYVVKHL